MKNLESQGISQVVREFLLSDIANILKGQSEVLSVHQIQFVLTLLHVNIVLHLQ